MIAAVTFAAGYLFAKYPELPGVLQHSVRKIKRALDDAKAEGIPEDLQEEYNIAYNFVLEFGDALEDGKLSWSETRKLGLNAYRMGRALLALLR